MKYMDATQPMILKVLKEILSSGSLPDPYECIDLLKIFKHIMTYKLHGMKHYTN